VIRALQGSSSQTPTVSVLPVVGRAGTCEALTHHIPFPTYELRFLPAHPSGQVPPSVPYWELKSADRAIV